MRFAEYHIERAYLLHELAQEHLDFNSFDVACSMARKSLEGKLNAKKSLDLKCYFPQRPSNAKVLFGASWV